MVPVPRPGRPELKVNIEFMRTRFRFPAFRSPVLLLFIDASEAPKDTGPTPFFSRTSLVTYFLTVNVYLFDRFMNLIVKP